MSSAFEKVVVILTRCYSIRLPVNWQALVGNNQASTSLATGFFTQFDNLVKASLSAGAYVMIDLHNYARWNGGIVGQGGPTDANVNTLWTSD